MSGTQPLRKAFNYTFAFKKAQDGDDRLIEGYATTEAVDRMGEVVSLKAVKAALKEYRQFPVIYADHKPPPVAEATKLSIDDTGLMVKSKFYNNTQASEEAWQLVQQGGYRAYSIGGWVDEIEWKEVNGEEIPHIIGLSIGEISLTGAPANPEALFEVIAKSIGPKEEESNMTDTEETPETPEEVEETPTELETLQKDVSELKGAIGDLKELITKGMTETSEEEEVDPDMEKLAKALAPMIAKQLGLSSEPEPVRTAHLTPPPQGGPPASQESAEPMTILRMIEQRAGMNPLAAEETKE